MSGNRLLTFGHHIYADRPRFIFKYKIPIFSSSGQVEGTFFTIFELHSPLIVSLTKFLEYLDLNLNLNLQLTIKEWAQSFNLIPILTAQEEKCLVYILKGLHSKEIAKLIGISFRTVQIHTENIKEKFLARDKHALLLKAAQVADFFILHSN